ncbi:MAG TPA: transcription antitermination protein NusB [Rhodospirillaceae bacterium]|nr:transcription antitermination protein NusB [Rhodospirillaceae bacterium]
MSSAPAEPKQEPTGGAKALAARLLAVQALYQNQQNQKPVDVLIDEYLRHRTGMEIDGTALTAPDGMLLKKIISGVHERRSELEGIVKANLKRPQEGSGREIEPLLKSIIMAATYELLAHQDIDFPVIINDYLHVTHAFYDKMEAGLVNGVLDPIARQLRS